MPTTNAAPSRAEMSAGRRREHCRGTLQEMQTVCLLADLLGFVANTADAVNVDVTY